MTILVKSLPQLASSPIHCKKGSKCHQLYRKEPIVRERLAPELNVQIDSSAPLLEKDWFESTSIQQTVVKKVSV